MGRPKVSDGKPLAIRLDIATRDRLEALRAQLDDGLGVTLAQVVRLVLNRGMDALGAPDAKKASLVPTPTGVELPTGHALLRELVTTSTKKPRRKP